MVKVTPNNDSLISSQAPTSKDQDLVSSQAPTSSKDPSLHVQSSETESATSLLSSGQSLVNLLSSETEEWQSETEQLHCARPSKSQTEIGTWASASQQTIFTQSQTKHVEQQDYWYIDNVQSQDEKYQIRSGSRSCKSPLSDTSKQNSPQLSDSLYEHVRSNLQVQNDVTQNFNLNLGQCNLNVNESKATSESKLYTHIRSLHEIGFSTNDVQKYLQQESLDNSNLVLDQCQNQIKSKVEQPQLELTNQNDIESDSEPGDHLEAQDYSSQNNFNQNEIDQQRQLNQNSNLLQNENQIQDPNIESQQKIRIEFAPQTQANNPKQNLQEQDYHYNKSDHLIQSGLNNSDFDKFQLVYAETAAQKQLQKKKDIQNQTHSPNIKTQIKRRAVAENDREDSAVNVNDTTMLSDIDSNSDDETRKLIHGEMNSDLSESQIVQENTLNAQGQAQKQSQKKLPKDADKSIDNDIDSIISNSEDNYQYGQESQSEAKVSEVQNYPYGQDFDSDSDQQQLLNRQSSSSSSSESQNLLIQDPIYTPRNIRRDQQDEQDISDIDEVEQAEVQVYGQWFSFLTYDQEAALQIALVFLIIGILSSICIHQDSLTLRLGLSHSSTTNSNGNGAAPLASQKTVVEQGKAKEPKIVSTTDADVGNKSKTQSTKSSQAQTSSSLSKNESGVKNQNSESDKSETVSQNLQVMPFFLRFPNIMTFFETVGFTISIIACIYLLCSCIHIHVVALIRRIRASLSRSRRQRQRSSVNRNSIGNSSQNSTQPISAIRASAAELDSSNVMDTSAAQLPDLDTNESSEVFDNNDLVSNQTMAMPMDSNLNSDSNSESQNATRHVGSIRSSDENLTTYSDDDIDQLNLNGNQDETQDLLEILSDSDSEPGSP